MKYRKIEYIKAMSFFGWKKTRAAKIVNRKAWTGENTIDHLVYIYRLRKA